MSDRGIYHVAKEYFGREAIVVEQEREGDRGCHRWVLKVPGRGEWRIGCNVSEVRNALEYARAFGLDALRDPMCIHNPSWRARSKPSP